MTRTSSPHNSARRHAIVVQPPLRLSRYFIDYPWFDSLAALQAAAVLERSGWSCRLLDGLATSDGSLTRLGSEVWLGQPAERFLERLGDLEGDLVLVHAGPSSSYQPGRSWLLELVSTARRTTAAPLVVADLVMGGMHYVESQSADLLAAGADLVLRYENEHLLGRLIEELNADRRPEGQVWEGRQAFDLADLPPPAWELVNPAEYFGFCARVLDSEWRPGPYPTEPLASLPLLTSRGCPFGCVFCSRNPGLPGDRRQLRTVPLEQVDRWIAGWKRDFGLERLVVLDELANLDRSRFDQLLDLLEHHRLRVEFPNGLRADRLRKGQVQRLARLSAGLKVSLESASLRVQHEVLGKNLDPAAVDHVASLCRTFGLPLEVHAMIGLPGETRPEILATLRACARLHEQDGAVVRLQTAIPLPGTPLETDCRERGLIPSEPPEDLAAGFQGRSLITTDQFDPDFLELGRRLLERRLAQPANRKVIVNLTYRCNNHCVFCAVGDRSPRDAEVQDVVDALRRHRAEGFDLLDVDGGEPSLHTGLLRVIAAGRELGYSRIALITNARRAAYPDFANRLVQSGLDEVLVSLHAPRPELQDLLTQAAGSFDQTCTGIRNLLGALGDPDRLAVNTTLVQANLESLEELGALLAGMGVLRWNLQLVTPFGRASVALLPDPAVLNSTLGALLERPPPGVRIQVVNMTPCALPGHEQAASMDFAKAERNMVFVGAGGENLQGYLADRRRPVEQCEQCAWALLCPGEYFF